MPTDRRLRAAERDIRACHEHSSVSHRLSFASARYVPRCACLAGAPEAEEGLVIAASQVRRHRDPCGQAPQGGHAVCSQEAEGNRRQAERPDGRDRVSPGFHRICRSSDTCDGRRSSHRSARPPRVGTWFTSRGVSRSFCGRKAINYDNPFVFSGSIDGGSGGDLHGDGQRDAATGSVTFEDAGTAISGCADQIVSLGTATCTLSGYASASTHSITATYSGDSNYIGSASSPLNQVVSKASTSTTLTSSVNPSMVRAARDLHSEGEPRGGDRNSFVR